MNDIEKKELLINVRDKWFRDLEGLEGGVSNGLATISLMYFIHKRGLFDVAASLRGNGLDQIEKALEIIRPSAERNAKKLMTKAFCMYIKYIESDWKDANCVWKDIANCVWNDLICDAMNDDSLLSDVLFKKNCSMLFNYPIDEVWINYLVNKLKEKEDDE